jgi:hypothetical protein
MHRLCLAGMLLLALCLSARAQSNAPSCGTDKTADGTATTDGTKTTDGTATDGTNSADGEVPRCDDPAVSGLSPGELAMYTPAPDKHVHWGALMRESFLYLVAQQGFRAGTQPYTVDRMNGPWFENWFRSVEALHGWSDGDGFFTTYMSHPFQGAAYNYMWQQNDPSCKFTTYRNEKHYWNCKFKGLAFSAASEIQWALGPISEASIGNTQLHHPPGVVDLFTTPFGGFGLVVAEDALDHKVIRRFETRVHSPFLRAWVRTIPEPGHSIANMLRLKYPWYRDDRGGVRDVSSDTPRE